MAVCVRKGRKNFFLKIFCIYSRRLQTDEYLTYTTYMFQSLPFTPRKLEATESRLQRIYDAAKLGLKGDSLALAAGMLPSEYRQLTQLDPAAEIAEMKGRADGEAELSAIMHHAARDGDAKIALEILKHKHAWVAEQRLSVEVTQQISITQALEQAQARVIEAIDVEHREADAPTQIENHAKADIRR